jgi:hypothetical protein
MNEEKYFSVIMEKINNVCNDIFHNGHCIERISVVYRDEYTTSETTIQATEIRKRMITKYHCDLIRLKQQQKGSGQQQEGGAI